MGAAIAFVLAAAGHPVTVQDPNAEAVQRLPGEIARIADLLGVTAPTVTTGSFEDAVAGATIVIEAGPEDKEIKQELFRRLDKIAPADAILATNTSAIPIKELASVVGRPERIVGTHFWNPPYAVELVEVVEAPQTNAAVVQRTIELLAAASMKPVHVKRDVPGFVGNRLQHALKREAIALVEAGVCDAETIDTVVKAGFGSRLAVLGPLEQSDLVGLDLTLAIHTTLLGDLDVSPGPQRSLVERVERGDLGMRTGEGFRKWTPEEAQAVRDQFDAYLVELARSRRDT